MRLLGLMICGLLLAPVTATAQRAATRFEITAVTDSTLSFRVTGAPWLKAGSTGVAVDPRRRDQLVARFRVVSVGEGVASALITGQTTDVSADHVATVVEPEVPWFKRGTFWWGLLLGGVLGVVGGAATT
jgi:hypothetical protein